MPERLRRTLFAIGIAVVVAGFELALPACASATSLAVGLEAGATRPDPQFQRYDWVRPVQPGVGVFAALEQSRWSVAIRGYATENRQRTETPVVEIDTRVRWYAVEVVPRVRVLGGKKVSLWAGVGAGRMRLDYAPDKIAIEIAETGESTIVHFASIDDWTASAGGALRVDTLPGWSVGLSLDHHWYRLDAMERSGNVVVVTHPDLAQWDLRVSLARRFGI